MFHGVDSKPTTPTDTTSLPDLTSQKRDAHVSASGNPQGISKEIGNPETAQKSRSKANETFNVFNAMKANFEKNRNVQILKKLLAPVFVIMGVFKKIYPSSSKVKTASAEERGPKTKTAGEEATVPNESGPAKTAGEEATVPKESGPAKTAGEEATVPNESGPAKTKGEEATVPKESGRLTKEEQKFKQFIDNPKSMDDIKARELGRYLSGPNGSTLLDHLSNLGNDPATRGSFVAFVEIMDTNSLDSQTCLDLMERLSDRAGLEITKALVQKELAGDVKADTLFRANSVASRMISAFQTNVIMRETSTEMAKIIEGLPNEPYRLKLDQYTVEDIDSGKAAELIPKEQERLLRDFSNITKTVEGFVSSEKFPSIIKEFNQFMEKEVDNKYGEGAGAKFAPQFFFLRFFNPSLIAGKKFNQALPIRSFEQQRVGVFLTKLIQTVVDEMETTKEAQMQFFIDKVNKNKIPEVAQFKEISKRLRTP